MKESMRKGAKEEEKQILYSYFTLIYPTGDGTEIVAKCLFQKIETGLDTYVIKNIFGKEDQVSCNVDNLNDDCVICFAEKVDVVILPCRHLSIGFNCASTIRESKKNRECPVCRMSKIGLISEIEKFIRINGL